MLRLVALVLVVSGCNQFAVRSDYDRRADFTRLQTYAWLPLSEALPADQRVMDRYIDARIRSAVDKELGAKGYRPADAKDSDFLLNYRVASEPGEAVKGMTRGDVVGWYGWPGYETFRTESYDTGTLFVAVVDPPSKHMIWIGSANARLLPHISLERRAKRVDAAIHKILGSFPPR
jgi:hypothetical protein